MKKPYRAEVLLAVKILIPVLGIIFFDWSIGTVFLYFCLEFLFIAAETVLRMICALQSGFWQKVGGLLRFMLFYSVIVLCTLALVGQFFDARKTGNMKTQFEMEILYLLGVVYLVDFLAGFIFNGRFKKMTSRDAEQETYRLMLLMFVTMGIFFLLMVWLVDPSRSNYVMGIGIILARNFAEYLMTKKSA